MKISHKTCKHIVALQIFFVVIMNFLIDYGAPSIIVYFTDFLMVVLSGYMLLYKKHTLAFVGAKTQSIIITTLIIYMVFDGLLNVVNPLLIFWAARKTFRGLIFFIACIRFLEMEDVDKIFKWLFIVQIFNICWTGYQFAVMGLRQDFLGGIFGRTTGANAWSNMFFCILLTYYTIKFIQEKQYLYKFLVVILSTIIMAALSEIKIFFIEFPLIILVVMIFAKVSYKKIVLAIAGVCMFYFAMSFFAKYYPLFYARFSSLSSIIDMGRDVGTGYNISRLGAFESISDLFFNNSIFRKIFGLGFGGCETSSLSFLNSPFYKTNGRYNYVWFGHMITFLETGYVGIILTLAFFLSVVVYSFRMKRQYRQGETVHTMSIFAITIGGIAIVNIWYNNFIRGELQYLVYFALATVFISVKSRYFVQSNTNSTR